MKLTKFTVFLCSAVFILLVNVNTFSQVENVQKIREYKEKADLKKYPMITQFIGTGSKPFGEWNPKAPEETKQFGQIVGVWETENTAWFQGKWYCCWRAVWAFKYTLDGFGVQDYYAQLLEDLPPPQKGIGRNSTLTQLRVYIPKDKNWKVSWISNTTGYGTFTGVEKNGEIIKTPPPVKGQPLKRVIFYDIKKDSFLWRQEVSSDNGKTWEKRFFIKATRIK